MPNSKQFPCHKNVFLQSYTMAIQLYFFNHNWSWSLWLTCILSLWTMDCLCTWWIGRLACTNPPSCVELQNFTIKLSNSIRCLSDTHRSRFLFIPLNGIIPHSGYERLARYGGKEVDGRSLRKRQRRGKLNCVRLVIIDTNLFPPNSLAEIASHTRVEHWLYIH